MTVFEELRAILHKHKENMPVIVAAEMLAEIDEAEVDCCKWVGFDNSLIEGKVIWSYKTSCQKWCIPEEWTDKHWTFCPYCGKRIKILEVE